MFSLTEFPCHFRRTFPQLLGAQVLVALSGGPDSVALLHLLADPEVAVTPLAAHVHHRVRGAEADLDAAFCRRLCSNLEVTFHLLYVEREAHPPEGREACWRRLRYAALHDLQKSLGAAAVATGHQRDDIAEGVLMQILRGSGPRALAGIATETAQGIIRPLLPWPRSELLQWLRDHQLQWCEDSSNLSQAHLRNVVRHHLLPVLEQHSPRLRGHLVALASALAEEQAFLAGELDRRAQWIDPNDPDGGVPLATLALLAPALRSHWLHAQAARSNLGRVTRRQLELFHSLLANGQPRAVSLAGRWRLRAARSRLWLEPPAPPPPYQATISPAALVSLPLPGWAVRMGPGEPHPQARWQWQVPLGIRQVVVRSPRPADTVAAEGRRVRLSALLARRLPRHLRSAWPVFSIGDTITWIPGVWQPAAPGKQGNLVLEVIRQ